MLHQLIQKKVELVFFKYFDELYKTQQAFTTTKKEWNIFLTNLIDSSDKLVKTLFPHKIFQTLKNENDKLQKQTKVKFHKTELEKIIKFCINKIISHLNVEKVNTLPDFISANISGCEIEIRHMLKTDKELDFDSDSDSDYIQNGESSEDEDSSEESDSDEDDEQYEDDYIEDEYQDEYEDEYEDEYNDDEESSNKQKLNTNQLVSVIFGISPKRGTRNSKNVLSNSKESKEFWKLLADRELKPSIEGEYYNNLSIENKQKLIEEMKLINSDFSSNPILFRLLESNLPHSVKSEVLRKLENTRQESENSKFNTWIEALLRIPFGKHKNLDWTTEIKNNPKKANKFFKDAEKKLDAVVYGHQPAKHKILQFIGQMVKNNSSNGLILGIQGPCGNGKTTLIEKGVSDIVGLPFAAIPLGGASDGCFLNGHSYTYEGSLWGQIADVLMKTGVMNPIIYMDELDKIAKTPKGDEIVNQLVHLIDASQNKHFQDRYFGNINIDLSRVTWIFSYNDADAINYILKDRIMQINTNGFTVSDKIKIAHEFLIPSICKEVSLKSSNIIFSDDIIRHLVNNYTFEGGVRKLKELLYDILRDINLDELRGDITLSSKRRRSSRKKSSTSQIYEITLDSIVSKYLKHLVPVVCEKIHDTPTVGKINGMYACANSMGGITPIETKWIPSDSFFQLSLTGNLGKVMKESADVAKTLSWELLTPKRQRYWNERWKTQKEALHIHCPDGAVQKEGPSAGTALTVAVLSLLTGNKIKNDIAITGEINLSGEVMVIGGLQSKLYGAKNAGCTHAFYPKQNQNDVDKICEAYPDLCDETFKISPISTVYEIIPQVLQKCENINMNSIAKNESIKSPSNRSHKRKHR